MEEAGFHALFIVSSQFTGSPIALSPVSTVRPSLMSPVSQYASGACAGKPALAVEGGVAGHRKVSETAGPVIA